MTGGSVTRGSRGREQGENLRFSEQEVAVFKGEHQHTHGTYFGHLLRTKTAIPSTYSHRARCRLYSTRKSEIRERPSKRGQLRPECFGADEITDVIADERLARPALADLTRCHSEQMRALLAAAKQLIQEGLVNALFAG